MAESETEIDARRLSRSYWWLWSSYVFGSSAGGLVSVVLPLLLVMMSPDPVLLAAYASSILGVRLVCAPVAGVVLDRLDRRRVLWIAQTTNAVLLLVLAGLVASASLSIVLLFVIGITRASLEPLINVSAEAIAPLLLHRTNLAKGHVYRQAAMFTAMVGAQIVAGKLFESGPVLPLWAAVILIATAAVAAWQIVLPDRGFAPRLALRPWERIALGAKSIWKESLLRNSLGLSILHQASVLGVSAILPLFVLQNLGGTDFHFGLLLAVTSGGVVAGTLLVGPAIHRLSPRTLFAISSMCLAAGLCLLAFASDVWTAAILIAVVGASVAITIEGCLIAIQLVVPTETLGTVRSAEYTASIGSQLIGTLLAGLLADLDLRLPFLLGAAAVLIGSLPLLVSLRSKSF